MQEIKICPFRVHRERIVGTQANVEFREKEEFMPCLKKECPAWDNVYERIPATNQGVWVEKCKRLG